MDHENGRSSTVRLRWLLVAMIVVFLVGFTLMENLVREEPEPRSAPVETAGDLFSPEAPVVHRLDDGAIEIRHDLFRRTTIRLKDEDDQQALFDCLSGSIEQTFGAGVEGWEGATIRHETRRMVHECMARNDRMRNWPIPQ